MAAFYVDEEEVWKCLKHPSRRRRTGICPSCLRERLASLCTDCANLRPCACSAATTATSSTSSFENWSTGARKVGPASNFTEREPTFRRSRSLAVPLIMRSMSMSKSKSKLDGDKERSNAKPSAFWGWMKGDNFNVKEGDPRLTLKKSRTKSRTPSDYSNGKRVGKWYFPSPVKAFRQSRLCKVFLPERSPMFRG